MSVLRMMRETAGRRMGTMVLILGSALFAMACEPRTGARTDTGGDAWTEAAGVVHTDRQVGIGTTTPHVALAVNGDIVAREIEVSVDEWPDYVFEEGYPLLPLDELAERLRVDGHLPGIPDAETVARDGLSLGAAQRQLLEKVEELTLYVLELERAKVELTRRVRDLEVGRSRE